MGFLGCQINSLANVFTAYSFNGALHSWHFSESNEWKSCVVPGGHFGAVEDLDWDSKGRYLITTSKDQTTRGLLLSTYIHELEHVLHVQILTFI